jgi:outer membrane protein assembly factor BamB
MLQYARPDRPKGDFLHVNSVTWLDAQAAEAFPGAKEGDLLISLRQIAVIAVLDIDARAIKWAVRGPWHMQHDPDVLSNGNLLVFDNRGDLANGGTSRVIELNPRTLETVWSYPEPDGDRLYTSIYGSQQRLPNGNTLIAESNNGRLLEITYDGEIVWDYRIAERKINHQGKELATAVFAERIKPETLSFLP